MDPTNSTGGAATACLQQGTSAASVPTLLLPSLFDETYHFFLSALFYYQYQYTFFVVVRVCKALLSCRAESGSLPYSCVEITTPILSVNCMGNCLLSPTATDSLGLLRHFHCSVLVFLL